MNTAAQSSLLTPQTTDILIVDDTLGNLVFLAEVLESEGFLVRKARNGEMALRAVETALPDLILLDICMPDMDGIEVCRRLKLDAVSRDIPVIFLSALDDVANKVRAFDVGGVDYITKPFQAAEVLARTQNHLSLKAAVDRVHQLNDHLEQQVQARTQQLEQANAQLMNVAYHDPLTQLPNRALLSACLARAIESMQHDADYQFALLFLDLDRFKLVNDSLGHTVGDRLLVEISQRLLGCLRRDDTLARFGGDEFVVLLHEVTDPQQVQRVAERLMDSLSGSFNLAGREIFVSASIGMVMSDVFQHDCSEHMLRDADTAMYYAKTSGRSRYSWFAPSMQQDSADTLQTETELHQGLQRQELVPYYQPIVNLRHQTVVGVEVLCRWHHPERGTVLPASFIPIAEETHLIIELGNQLLEAACRQLRQWQQQNLVSDDFYISFNMPARHLCRVDLPDHILACLERHQLQAHHLRLEITESSVLDNDVAIQVMEVLKSHHIHLSVDDFGTGYASLSYLHQLPVSTLKIDRTFVKDINHNEQDASVVAAIIGIAQTLKLNVIAEGIDDPAQITMLRQMGCLFGQGYLFARPLPAIDIQTLLADNYTVEEIATNRSAALAPSLSCFVSNPETSAN